MQEAVMMPILGFRAKRDSAMHRSTPARRHDKSRPGASDWASKSRMRRSAPYCSIFVIAALVQLCAPHAEAQKGAKEGEWRSYGGDLGSTKYSPLDQIHRGNFRRLEIAWRWKSPDGFLSKSGVAGGEWAASSELIFNQLNQEDPDRWRDRQPPRIANFKATPIMIGGVLYLNTPASVGAAVDAGSGKTIWIYNPKSYESGTTTMSARWNQRGVAYWTDGTEARIYWGTGDGYLIAVDAETGRPVAEFGENGRVDLMQGLPRARRGERDHLNALTYSVQSPPIVVRDLVIAPASISSLTIRKEAIPGWIRAWDVRTGELRWVFRTVPTAGEFGNETWEDDSWEYVGKVTVWTMMSADEELGYLYLPMNTAGPDYYGGHRPGDNLFAESLVCLDVETGKRVWHFQMVHHGLWDYDNPAASNLLDITVDGKDIKAVEQVTKQGFCYVFDRVTGEPVWPIEERQVPVEPHLPGEQPSPTQPFPTRPAPFEYQGVSLEDLVDFTPELREMALEVIKNFQIGPLFTPQTLPVPDGTQGTIERPGVGGGANWSGAAVDPETGMLYVPSSNAFSVLRFREPAPGEASTLRYIQTRGATARMPEGLPLFKPPYSRMTAIDMNTGDHAWMAPLGEGNRVRNHPLLKDLNLGPVGGDGRGGPLLTRTLLISALTAGGTDDGPRLVARDKSTGEEIAWVDLPRRALGTPMTYLLDGEQYIALTIAGDPPELIAFKLP